MRTIIFSLFLGLTILFSAFCAILGASFMAYDIWTANPNLFKDFQIFTLSSILFFVTITSYIVTKTLTNTEVLASVMEKYFQHEMNKMAGPGDFLKNIFGGFPTTGSISVSTVDENGNIVPLGEAKDFKSPEEFTKHRDELLSRAFGFKPSEQKKKLEQMTIEELRAEEKKAVAAQKFELAQAIINIIEEKTKSK